MKQRVITAAVLLALLALVVWQIYTPLFIVVVAIFSAIAAGEIMKCAKVTNRFLFIVGVATAFFVPFFSSESVLEPFVPTYTYMNFLNSVPKAAYVIVIVIAYFLAMLKDYEHTKFEDVAITIVASFLVPGGFAMFGALRDMTGYGNQIGIYLIFYGLICALGTDVGAQLGGMALGKTKMSPKISPKKTVEGAVSDIGLLSALYGTETKGLLYSGRLKGNAKGGLYENLIAGVLDRKGIPLYYFKSEDGAREVEFAIERDGGIVPVEVKASNGATISLNEALENPQVPYGYKFIDGNVGVSGKKITLPHYMAMFI